MVAQAGDVWVASGQSNMAFPFARGDGGTEEARNAAFPRLLFFKIPNTPSDTCR